LRALKISAKEIIIIVNEPTISKIGPKKLKNDTISTLINTNPESIAAKNKKINSIVIPPPFSLEYEFQGGGDWILEEILQFYYKKTDRNWPVLVGSIFRRVPQFVIRKFYFRWVLHHWLSLLPQYI
jgi:hypothetical protein